MFPHCGPQLDSFVRRQLGLGLLAVCIFVGFQIDRLPATAQEAPDARATADAAAVADAARAADAAGEADNFVAATSLLPRSVAGLIRIPHFPRLCNAWEQTHIGRLLDEPSMQPFIEAQRERFKSYLQSIDNKIGIRLEDLYEIASGEVVVSWLPFANDKRRPFAICVIADVRGNKARADEALATIDKDLRAGGWQRKDVTHRDQTVRVYDTKPKPGQLKVEQIAITLSDQRIIAADRDSVVTDLLDAIAGQAKGDPIAELEEFVTVLQQSTKAISQPIIDGQATVGAEWFIKPFQMGRVLRETFQVDRGNQVDVIKLLENQGFDVIRGAGGIVALNGKKYDLLHRGVVLANPDKLTKAARMLQFTNHLVADIPEWVDANTASFNRLHLKIEEAFWASESLINEAFGDEIFRDIIEGIREDEDGPQIDIEANVLPNLDDQILLMTDNTLPAGVQSERMLLAIRVKDAKAIENAIRKAMEVEPDASKLDAIPGVEIWRVQRTETDDGFDAELFGDLELDFGEEDAAEAPPLLEHWAIALVPAGPGSKTPYLMFSSHPELLISTAKRIVEGAAPGSGLNSIPEVKPLMSAIKNLGANNAAFDRLVRTKLSLRAKYQLLRKGELKDSDALMATLYRRLFENEAGGEPDPLNAAKLPPLEQIEQHLPNGGGYFQSTDLGWEMTGFFLK